MSDKSAYEQKVAAKLDEWGAEIDKLKAKASSAQADKKIELQQQIDKLESQRDEARNKLDELKASGSDAWEDLKGGIDNATSAIGNALRSAQARFS
jgi:chromosome segregation ATPase